MSAAVQVLMAVVLLWAAVALDVWLSLALSTGYLIAGVAYAVWRIWRLPHR